MTSLQEIMRPASKMGNIKFAGGGTATPVTAFPFFDKTVTFQQDEAIFEM